MKLSHVKKAAAQAVLLAAGIATLCFGVWRGEAATVLSKAIKLCLECVGIG
jgi:C4-dicarboxylate transporter